MFINSTYLNETNKRILEITNCGNSLLIHSISSLVISAQLSLKVSLPSEITKQKPIPARVYF